MMAFCPEHPKWNQNPKFTPLSRRDHEHSHPFHMRSPSPGAKTLPDGAPHTYIAHIREYPLGFPVWKIIEGQGWNPCLKRAPSIIRNSKRRTQNRNGSTPLLPGTQSLYVTVMTIFQNDCGKSLNNCSFRCGADELENVKSYKYPGLIVSPFGNLNLAR